jgi:hypothetical protein
MIFSVKKNKKYDHVVFVTTDEKIMLICIYKVSISVSASSYSRLKHWIRKHDSRIQDSKNVHKNLKKVCLKKDIERSS